ncbi:MAG: ABC transporter ATP-binding protein [Candidatus Omnitrophota bacterium]|nr:ABC transporter ATP-binding protein [Candidatus Omnitrophota bacterium]MDD5537830.1 ABC transporter ATP-binding protein [Candidatus Omnitrophota bacterium]
MIELINVSKNLGGKQVLDHMSLTVEEGETKVIIGRSGVGKSVTLKHIVRLLEPDEGNVRVEGRDVLALHGRELNELHMEIGLVFQGGALFDSLTVGENVGFILREHMNMAQSEIDKRVKESLALVGLYDVELYMPADLSGGMKKRVALARAICTRPKIILYDEPTTGVDPITADAINQLIDELHDKLKVTSIVVTHDMRSAYKVADRIAMLYEGKIIAEGTPDEIRYSHNPYVHQFITGAAHGPITDGQNSVSTNAG